MSAPDDLNALGAHGLPGHLGLVILEAAPGRVRAELAVQPHHMAPNGYLHAGAIVTLADTCCGYGATTSRPEGATGFTTIELKSNHLGTAREGVVDCTATMAHGGRTTQVWDAVVTHRDTGRTMALFRCTQLLLYPRPAA